MSIFIMGMEMPRSCAECPVNMNICKRGYKYLLAHMELYDQRADDCPITTVPPHGRLIDKDALEADISASVVFSGRDGNAEIVGAKKIINRLHVAPTVIDVEEGE